jgi:peptide/nickel transport system substrate-binding protein
MKKLLMTVLVIALVLSLSMTGCVSRIKAEKTQDKETLVVAMGADARSLDPHATNDAPSSRIMKQVYDTLMHQTETLKIEKGLVKDYKIVSDTEYEFELRSGVMFHNGEELKSSDVKFTFERMISKNSPAKFLVDALDRVEVIDDYKFKMILKFPFGPFLTHLGHTATSIVNEKAVVAAGDNYGRNPVGTGAFKFVNWQAGDSITLERFDDYYQGAAKSQYVKFRFIPEDAQRAIALETGEADIVYDVGANDYDGLKALTEDIITFQTKGLTTFYMGFNMNKKPFDDVRVRKAINLALDVDKATDVAFMGYATTAKGPLAPTVQFANTKIKGYGYNVEEAKRLLKEAGYENGFKTSIWTNNNPVRVKYAEIFKEQLLKVGIEVSIEIMEFAPYLDRTALGEHEMFMLGWVAVTGDADYGLYSLFHSSQFGDAGNRTFYKNNEVDRLLDEGKKNADSKEREKAYHKVQEIVTEDAPWVFLSFRDDLNATRTYVEGFVVHMAGHHNLHKVYNR